jgi:hypothetical protein
VLLSKGKELSAPEKFYGFNPPWVTSLGCFGEVCIFSDDQHKKIRRNFTDQEILCLFIGYPDSHAANVYQSVKLDNEQFILSRNVIWLNKKYAEYKGILTVNTVNLPEDEDNIE